MLGMWTAKYSASQACIYNVYATTNLTVSAGFLSGPNAVHLNNVSQQLMENVPSYFVAHANGLPCPGTLKNLQVYENAQLIYSNSLRTRYNCAYEKYLGLVTCSSASVYFYKVCTYTHIILILCLKN